MDLVVEAGPNTWQIAYTWLPTWIGMNKALMMELQRHLRDKFEDIRPGKPGLQDELNNEVASWLQSKFPNIEGLEAHLLHLAWVKPKDW
jgi:hypothetical protein